MKNCDGLQKRTTNKACERPETPPAEGKGRSKKYYVYPEQERMEAELCKLYHLDPSELHRRQTEYEYWYHPLGNYLANALKQPIRPPPPAITPDKPQ